MMSFWNILVFGFAVVAASVPENKQDNPDGFWFGTQWQKCISTNHYPEEPPFPRLSRRSVDTKDDEMVPVLSSESGVGPSAIPACDTLYRNVFYKDTLFECDMGIHGSGPKVSSIDVPVTWDQTPTGMSICPIFVVKNFILNYVDKFGPRHLVNNNCNHFANRFAALLSDPNCAGETSSVDSKTSVEGDAKEEASTGIISCVKKCVSGDSKEADIMGWEWCVKKCIKKYTGYSVM